VGQFIKVATKQEIPADGGKVCEAGDKTLAVFCVGGDYFAIDNMCKHRGGPLGEGPLDGDQVVCPWHGWVYDVKTGECITNPNVCQDKFNVKVEGNDILVEV
jgi:nitrite reductase/ring-hydroxylating ferredoxin subunit